MKRITIAIDGTSSSGKSSIAKKLATKLNYTYIDTGAMYRAITLLAMQTGALKVGQVDESALQQALQTAEIKFVNNAQTGHADTYLNGANVEQLIRGMEVSGNVSQIAAIPFVRATLVAQQQKMGEAGGIVMDGRDIGTTVFPCAEMKIFMSASPEVRAHRRYLELQGKGLEANYDEILKNVVERDRIDMTREVSPLRRASDAIDLNTDNMTMEEELDFLLDIYQSKANE